MLRGWFAVPASGRNRDSLLFSENRFFSWLDIRLQTLCYVYADSTKLPIKFHLLATQWSLWVWLCVLSSCPLCSQQDLWCLSKASRVVGAMGSCFQAVFKLPRTCCMDGAWSMLLIWNLHMYRCIFTVSSVYPCLCVVLSRAASSTLLNAFTPGNNSWSSGKVACLYAAQSLYPYNSLVVSLVTTWWHTCPLRSLLGPLVLRCDHYISVWVCVGLCLEYQK